MRCVAPALALLTLIPVPGRAGLWELLSGRRVLEVITVTDVSSTGSFVPPASPAQPQFYFAASMGFRELGGALAGTEEPPEGDVIHLIAAALAKQGYLPATSRSAPASLVLVYTWGTLNTEKLWGGDPSMPPAHLNRGQILRFLGGQKVGLDEAYFDPLTAPVPGLQLRNYGPRSILAVSDEDFYVIVVSAYELDAALQKKHRPPLWTTRIAAPSLGFDLGDVMPAMLAIGAEQFGRDTPQPVWIKASEKFKPDVRLGELQLLESLGDEPLPVPKAGDPSLEEK